MSQTSATTAPASLPNERAAPTRRRDRVRLVVILGALSAFGPLSLDMYLPGLPALAEDLGTTAYAAQLTLSACLLGLASGQLVAGPISDALGRRRPLLIGVAAYTAISLLCAAAPSITALVVLRYWQGFAGAAGIVIARAIVRDLHSGTAAARFFSTLMLVTGLAPILAPIFGGQLLRFTSWRGVFVALALIGVALFLAALLGVRETVAAGNRQPLGFRATAATFRRLLSDVSFLRYALPGGLASASLFTYIAGSSFVLQDIYGLSPQAFSLAFGGNALGYVTAGQVNGRLVGRVPLKRLLIVGLVAITSGGYALLAAVSLDADLVWVLASLLTIMASFGFILPNTTALALAAHPRTAGSASALLGLLQFAIGAAAAPLVGIAGRDTALPMALVIALLVTAALLTYALLGRRSGSSTGTLPLGT